MPRLIGLHPRSESGSSGGIRQALALTVGFVGFAKSAAADPYVSVVAHATPVYAERKFGGPQVRSESYVFMAGRFFSGITVDRSIDRMTFRHIAESLAPELARQQYFPAADPHAADLLLIVHWGTTRPFHEEEQAVGRTQNVTDATGTRATGVNEAVQLREWDDSGAALRNDENAQRMFSIAEQFPDTATGLDGSLVTNPFALTGEGIDHAMTTAGNMQLLGYARSMRRHSRTAVASPEEDALRFDLMTERYFIILQAFDLRQKIAPGQRRRPVWTVHLNMRSPGTNFERALAAMGQTAVDYFGRNLDAVQVTLPRIREGKVEIGEPIILGEVK